MSIVVNHLSVYFETPGPLDPEKWDEAWDRLTDAIEDILCGHQGEGRDHRCKYPWTSGGHRHLEGAKCRECDE